MEVTIIARQALLYGHIIAFAVALGTILTEDVRLLRAQRIDWASLLATAKLVKWLLLALWITGVPMMMMDVGADVSRILASPKLMAKLIVVGVLTLNGLLLHIYAFPMVTREHRNRAKIATIVATLGAVSAASWLYASFVAVARDVAPYFSLEMFVMLYLLVTAVAIAFATSLVRKRLQPSLISSSGDLTGISADQLRVPHQLQDFDEITLAPPQVPSGSQPAVAVTV